MGSGLFDNNYIADKPGASRVKEMINTTQ